MQLDKLKRVVPLYNPNKALYYDDNGVVVHVESLNEEPSQTNQDFLAEVDVNNIMDRFLQTGELSHVSRSKMIYNEKPGTPAEQHVLPPTDLMSALNQIQQSARTFHQLNKKLKNRFQTPDQLAEYLENPANHEEAEKLGILPKTNKIKTNEKETTEQKQNPSDTGSPAKQ